MRSAISLALLVAPLALLPSCMGPLNGGGGPKPRVVLPLEDDLQFLKAAFNAHPNLPTMVALLPQSCGRSLEALNECRTALTEIDTDGPVAWIIIWQDEVQGDQCHHSMILTEDWQSTDPLMFHDCERLAGRHLAHGNVLTGYLKRAVLFFPPGAVWDQYAPDPSAMVLDMGRVDPDRAGDAREMAKRLRQHWTILARPR